MNGKDSKPGLISAHARGEIDAWIAKYPPEQKRSALLSALTVVQEENGGWLSTELMDAVAEYLELPTIAVYEVASFYSMYELEPVGRHKVSVCNNISCMLGGADRRTLFICSSETADKTEAPRMRSSRILTVPVAFTGAGLP